MSSEPTAAFLEPLEELLKDPEVQSVFIDGPRRIWVERGGELHAASLSLSALDLDEMAAQVLRRAGARPGQIMASCCLPEQLRVDLVQGVEASGGPVLVISRELPRAQGLAEILDPTRLASGQPEVLARALREERGLLVVGRDERARGMLLMALIEEIPEQERVVLIDRGRISAPKHPRLLRLRVDPGRDASRHRLVQAAQVLRAQRLLLDELSGPEVRDILLGVGEGLLGPIVGVAAASLAEGLDRVRSLAATVGGLGLHADTLIAQRFALALLVQEEAQRRVRLVEVATLGLGPKPEASLVLEGCYPREGVPTPVHRRSEGRPSSSEQQQQSPGPEPPVRVSQEDPEARPGPEPQGEGLPAELPITAVVRAGPSSHEQAPSAGSTQPVEEPGGWRAALKVREGPGDDIFDEMLASLQDLPPARDLHASWPTPREAEGGEEIDDSLLVGGEDVFPDHGLSLPHAADPEPMSVARVSPAPPLPTGTGPPPATRTQVSSVRREEDEP